MFVILVALTFVVAILVKSIIHHPAQKRKVVQVKPESEWMIISTTSMMPSSLKA